MDDSGRFDITAHGAVGDGAVLCTDAVQAALDAAGAKGGGTVYVPPGTFRIGTVFLRSGVTLDIHPAGRLLGSPELTDYKTGSWGQHIDRTPWHLIVARDVHDVTIRGGGTIDGNGPAFWEPVVDDPAYAQPAPPGAFEGIDALHAVVAREPDLERARLTWIQARDKRERPSPMLEISRCRDVRIRDVCITNSAGWLVHLHCCDHVWIRGVRLTANLMGPNNDGFDITGCRDVMISDCSLRCCDDAIVLKTTPDARSCERITVTNCVIQTPCVALKCGYGESFHDFRQIVFSNCVVHGSSRALGLYTVEGGTIEDVTVSNIVCDTNSGFMCNRPVHLDCRRRAPDAPQGRIRNVSIANMICRTDGRLLMTAPPDAPLENITLRDVHVVYPTLDDPDPIAGDVGGGQFSNASPEARIARAALVVDYATDLVIDNLRVTWPDEDAAGHMVCPPAWHRTVKAANGSETLYERPSFAPDRVPPFSVLWGRGLQGGYVRAPLARPAAGATRYALQDCSIATDGA